LKKVTLIDFTYSSVSSLYFTQKYDSLTELRIGTIGLENFNDIAALQNLTLLNVGSCYFISDLSALLGLSKLSDVKIHIYESENADYSDRLHEQAEEINNSITNCEITISITNILAT
jgi:hypothetical protein